MPIWLALLDVIKAIEQDPGKHKRTFTQVQLINAKSAWTRYSRPLKFELVKYFLLCSNFLMGNQLDSNQLLLKRWFVPTHLENQTAMFSIFSLADKRLRELPKEEVATLNLVGWYQPYTEGIFSIFKISSNQWCIYCNDQLLNLTPELKIFWKNTLGGRQLNIFRSEKLMFSFRYQTWRAILRDPTYIFDDDWGLVADLPSFLHSNSKNFDLLDQALKMK
ncbi:MAG: hypothetical protein ACXWRE_07550 [Pseudobdellovibrionaceae bacterium]